MEIQIGEVMAWGIEPPTFRHRGRHRGPWMLPGCKSPITSQMTHQCHVTAGGEGVCTCACVEVCVRRGIKHASYMFYFSDGLANNIVPSERNNALHILPFLSVIANWHP